LIQARQCSSSTDDAYSDEGQFATFAVSAQRYRQRPERSATMNSPKPPIADHSTAMPDVGSDRLVPKKDAPTGNRSDPPKRPPLEIKEIEDLEDDAKGG
jgi:hypothetical protein